MNYREYRNSDRKHSDPVLGTVALGALLLILAWVVTGLDFLAIVALLIALGYVRMAGTFKSSGASVSAEVEPQKRGAIPHALATDARFHGLAVVHATGGAYGDAHGKASRKGLSTGTRRRSAYDGHAD